MIRWVSRYRPMAGHYLRRFLSASASCGSNEFMKLQVSVASEVRCRARQFLVADRAIQNCDASKSAHRIRPNPRCPDTPIVTDSSNQLSSGTKEKHRQMALHHLCRGRAFRLVDSTRIQPIGSPGADIAPVKERRRVWVARGARRAPPKPSVIRLLKPASQGTAAPWASFRRPSSDLRFSARR